MMPNPLLAALSPPVVVSYSILNQIWYKILSWLPCLLLWSSLIQFLFKSDAKSSSGCLASSCGRFLFNSYSKMMQNPLLAALSPPVVVSYSLLNQIWYKILSWRSSFSSAHFLFNSYSKMMKNLLLAPFLLQCSFLIQFLFKTDAKSSPDCLPPPALISYQLLFKNDTKSSPGYHSLRGNGNARAKERSYIKCFQRRSLVWEVSEPVSSSRAMVTSSTFLIPYSILIQK